MIKLRNSVPFLMALALATQTQTSIISAMNTSAEDNHDEMLDFTSPEDITSPEPVAPDIQGQDSSANTSEIKQSDQATQAPIELKKPVTYSKKDLVDYLKEIAKQHPKLPKKIEKLLKEIKSSDDDDLNEEVFEKVFEKLISFNAAPEQAETMQAILNALVKKGQKFTVSGSSFCVDPNGGFILDTQDPKFTVTYKDAKGNVKKRMYKADIQLVGLNVELAFRFNWIFFTDENFNYHDSNKVITLGKGIQINPCKLYYLATHRLFDIWPRRLISNSAILTLLSLFDFTYIPFENAQGGMVIATLDLGFPNIINIAPLGNIISLVKGGTLTPVEVA